VHGRKDAQVQKQEGQARACGAHGEDAAADYGELVFCQTRKDKMLLVGGPCRLRDAGRKR
jgi:hypothetical protein